MKTTSKQVKLFSLFAVFWFFFGAFLFLVCFLFRVIIRNFAAVETKTDSLWHE